MRLLCKELKFGLMKNYYLFHVWISVVQLRCNDNEIATNLNKFNQSLERKTNLLSLVYVLKKPSHHEILS